MHESTISRVTSNKYVHTPQGLFELKYFFNSLDPPRRTTRTSPRESVKQAIKKIIVAEDKSNPYSDQAIVEDPRGHGRHQDRAAHRGQVPRDARHPLVVQAQEVLPEDECLRIRHGGTIGGRV